MLQVRSFHCKPDLIERHLALSLKIMLLATALRWNDSSGTFVESDMYQYMFLLMFRQESPLQSGKLSRFYAGLVLVQLLALDIREYGTNLSMKRPILISY